jgi:hypothetical protein
MQLRDASRAIPPRMKGTTADSGLGSAHTHLEEVKTIIWVMPVAENELFQSICFQQLDLWYLCEKHSEINV